MRTALTDDVRSRFWHQRYAIILIFLVSLPGLAGYVWFVLASPRDLIVDIPVPTQSDWVDLGLIFPAGELGEWDFQLWGGFTNAIVKKDGTFYLYYQGASGYRTAPDETVTWRAIGVATSPDGINFRKSEENPVVTWFPNNSGEEGAVSAGVALDDRAEIVLYYGANTEESDSRVNADGRLAVSSDGFQFDDQGVVLDRLDRSLWASGDELFPILAIHDLDKWIVYYLPNGRLRRRQVGVAWGPAPKELTRSAPVKQGFSPVLAWGTAGQAQVGANTYALFFNLPDDKMEARLMSPKTPQRLSKPVASYQFDGVTKATFWLDEQARTWFMFYRDAGGAGYGVMIAPAGEPDITPPAAPGNIVAEPLSHEQIKLAWDPAIDADTGIATYNIFRNGQQVATVKGWEYVDEGLRELINYDYQVAATNYHGFTGAPSPKVNAATLPDSLPPVVTTLHANPSGSELVLTFDESIDQTSAEMIGNFQIVPEISVYDATLDQDQRTLTLATSPHRNGSTYQVTFRNIRDQSQQGNMMVGSSQLSYTYSEIAGLAGAWNFDQFGDILVDTSNFGNDGMLDYLDLPGPTAVPGLMGRALEFDGLDDHVTVSGVGSLAEVTDHSHTLAVWALPDGQPAAKTPNDTDYTLLSRRGSGLFFDARRRFRAQVRLSDGALAELVSEPVTSDAWHHIAMVVDERARQLHLFVDGRETLDSPVQYDEADLAIHGQAPYYFGTSDPLPNRYENRFAGRIDEVRIFDRALSSVELLSLYRLNE